MIRSLDEETVRMLAIRVLSRGIGSLEFIQSELVPEDDSDGPLINAHGSPVRRLAVRATTSSSENPDRARQDIRLALPPVHQHQTGSLHQTDQGSQRHLYRSGASVVTADN